MFEQEFDAQVIDGQLAPADALRDFEGQKVHVTIAAVPALELPDLEPPDDLDVEKDLYVAMPFPTTTKTETQVTVLRLQPCLIFPEDPDCG